VILKPIAKLILKLTGWTTTGQLPDLDKAIYIAAPHTTNWDAFWLIVYKVSMDVKLRFLAKHTLFWWPLGSLLSWFGAMPLDRNHASSTVQQMVDRFEETDHLILALAPEGTRKWKPYWKTGFYQISAATNVPIVLAYIDYANKKVGIGPTLLPSGDVDQDMAVIRKFYEPFGPRHAALRSPVEFPPTQK
jgi:1-acyl-sn-glycerol-3-phosphate acyltransferase